MGQTTGQTMGPISWSDLLAQETKRDPEQLVWTLTPILRGLTSLPVAF